MNQLRTSPVLDRPPFSETVLEQLAAGALRHEEGLFPDIPSEVRIENVVEAVFGFNETYEPLEKGVLGEIHFGLNSRPLRIRLASQFGVIDDNLDIDHERRATLAHECGHGLAHGSIFARNLSKKTSPRFPGFDDEPSHIECRDEDIHQFDVKPTLHCSADRWLEWEANYLMVALLLPLRLVQLAVKPWLVAQPIGVAPNWLPEGNREAAIAFTARTFNVGTDLARRRITDLFSSEIVPDLLWGVSCEAPRSSEVFPPNGRLSKGRIKLNRRNL